MYRTWLRASTAMGKKVKEVPMTETRPVPITMPMKGILICDTCTKDVMPDTIRAAEIRYCSCSVPL